MTNVARVTKETKLWNALHKHKTALQTLRRNHTLHILGARGELYAVENGDGVGYVEKSAVKIVRDDWFAKRGGL